MTTCRAFIQQINRLSRVQEKFVCQIEEPQPPDLLSPVKTCKEADISNISKAEMHKEKMQTQDATVKREENREKDSREKRRLDRVRFARTDV